MHNKQHLRILGLWISMLSWARFKYLGQGTYRATAGIPEIMKWCPADEVRTPPQANLCVEIDKCVRCCKNKQNTRQCAYTSHMHAKPIRACMQPSTKRMCCVIRLHFIRGVCGEQQGWRPSNHKKGSPLDMKIGELGASSKAMSCSQNPRTCMFTGISDGNLGSTSSLERYKDMSSMRHVRNLNYFEGALCRHFNKKCHLGWIRGVPGHGSKWLKVAGWIAGCLGLIVEDQVAPDPNSNVPAAKVAEIISKSKIGDAPPPPQQKIKKVCLAFVEHKSRFLGQGWGL